MKEAIKKLSKKQLQDALLTTLNWHEKHYNEVEQRKESVHEGFYMLSGVIISVRDEFNLPPLK